MATTDDTIEKTKRPKRRGTYGNGTRRRNPKTGKIEVRFYVNGQRRSFTADTEAEAKKLQRQLAADLEKGKVVVTDHHTTLAKYLEQWLAGKTKLRPTSRLRYEELIRLHIAPRLGRVKLAELTKAQLTDLYKRKEDEGLAHNTVVRIHAVLRSALNDAVADEVLARNVAARIKDMTQERAETETWTAEQANTFLDAVHAADDPLEAFYVLALTTGMRRGEILGLHWKDVDLTNGTFTVRYTLHYRAGDFTFDDPKTDAGNRQLPLTDVAVDALKRHKRRQAAMKLKAGPAWRESGKPGRGGLIFTRPDGTPERGNHILQRKFEPLCLKLGLPRIRLHDCRHTCASLLYAMGFQDADIAKVLGHSSPSVTRDIYIHVGAERLREATDALNGLFRSKLG